MCDTCGGACISRVSSVCARKPEVLCGIIGLRTSVPQVVLVRESDRGSPRNHSRYASFNLPVAPPIRKSCLCRLSNFFFVCVAATFDELLFVCQTSAADVGSLNVVCNLLLIESINPPCETVKFSHGDDYMFKVGTYGGTCLERECPFSLYHSFLHWRTESKLPSAIRCGQSRKY